MSISTQVVNEVLFSDDDDEQSNSQLLGYIEFEVNRVTEKREVFRGENIVGRTSSKGATILIDDPTVSSAHARVTAISESTFFITDLKSTNGTYVDHIPLIESYRQYSLRSGAFIRFGHIEVKFLAIATLPPTTNVDLLSAPTLAFTRSPLGCSRSPAMDSLFKDITPNDGSPETNRLFALTIPNATSLLTEPLQTTILQKLPSNEKVGNRFDSDDIYQSLIEQARKPKSDVLLRPKTPISADVYDLDVSPEASPIEKRNQNGSNRSNPSSSKMEIKQTGRRTVLMPLNLETKNVVESCGERQSAEVMQQKHEGNTCGSEGGLTGAGLASECGSATYPAGDGSLSLDRSRSTLGKRRRQKREVSGTSSTRSSSSKRSSRRKSNEDGVYYGSHCDQQQQSTSAETPRRSSRLANRRRPPVNYSDYLLPEELSHSEPDTSFEQCDSDDDAPLLVLKKRFKSETDSELGLRTPSSDVRRDERPNKNEREEEKQWKQRSCSAKSVHKQELTIKQRTAVDDNNLRSSIFTRTIVVFFLSGFTVNEIRTMKKELEEVGVSVTSDIFQATHVIGCKVRITTNLLCAIARRLPIVSRGWIRHCLIDGKAEYDYLLEDKEGETSTGINLKRLYERRERQPLLKGYTICATEHITPDVESISLVARCAGADFRQEFPPGCQLAYLITCARDRQTELFDEAISRSIMTITAKTFFNAICADSFNPQRPKRAA